MKNKIIAFLLILVLILNVSITTIFAATTDEEVKTAQEEIKEEQEKNDNENLENENTEAEEINQEDDEENEQEETKSEENKIEESKQEENSNDENVQEEIKEEKSQKEEILEEIPVTRALKATTTVSVPQETTIKSTVEQESTTTTQEKTIESTTTEQSTNNSTKTETKQPDPKIQYRTHVQDVGWQAWKSNGQMSGTSGRSLRLEGINIKIENMPNVHIKYQVHVQDIGWQGWKKDGEMAGTSGQAKRLEGIRIYLQDTDKYSVMYRVHVQDIGWQGWRYDGEMAGTSGQAKRLEGIEIKIVAKKNKSKINIDSPSNNQTLYSPSTINVSGWKMGNYANTTIKAYVDNKQVDSSKISYFANSSIVNKYIEYGTATQNAKPGFKFATDGKSLSDGNHTIKIDLYAGNTKLNSISRTIKIDRKPHVSYRSHVQNIGWQGYVQDGAMSGTEGKAYRVEAMNIKLINVPSNAKILYRAHVQDIGWQGWKSNGEMTGTSGQSKRVESIQIKLQNLDAYTVEYRVHVQDIGWTSWYIDGESAGTEGQSKRIEAIQIRIVNHYERKYKGIDVSEFNGSINWSKVKNSGVKFAIVRLGYRGYRTGKIVIDSKALENLKGAKAQGIKVGVYFYTQAINAAEGKEEAKWCIDTLKNNKITIEYPIIIDTERSTADEDRPGRADELDKNTRTAACKGFCEEIKRNGKIPMIYASTYWFYDNLDLSKLTSYEVWLANYTKASLNRKFSIWQYTSEGSVPGISGNVDLDWGYKNY